MGCIYIFVVGLPGLTRYVLLGKGVRGLGIWGVCGYGQLCEWKEFRASGLGLRELFYLVGPGFIAEDTRQARQGAPGLSDPCMGT